MFISGICCTGETFINLSCSHDDPEDDVVIRVRTDPFLNSSAITCVNVSSFKLIPDLTDYFGSYKIDVINCMVPRNESIKQLTTKISKNVKNLEIHFDKKEMNLSFDKNYFEGLSSVERLVFSLDHIKANISANVFENLVNLKSLNLYYLPLSGTGIFDTLENLQNLKMISDVDIEFQRSDFKNLRNLVELNITCSDNCSKCLLDPFIFENLVNLNRLQITNFRTPGMMLANMIHLQEVQLSNTDFKELPEDFFKNSTNIERIKLYGHQLETIPKNVFADQSKLFKLDLRNNPLKELTDGTFDTTINLKYLDLRGNRLTSISRYVIKIKTMINGLK